MDFPFNALDAIPFVGHVKGVVQHAFGDCNGGNKAIYQSTRTLAVLAGGAIGLPVGAAVGFLVGVVDGFVARGVVGCRAGGAVGCLIGGLIGAIVGGVCAGIAADIEASVVIVEQQGIVKFYEDIVSKLRAFSNPIESIVSAGMQIGLDGLGGCGMGCFLYTGAAEMVLIFLALSAWKQTEDGSSESSQSPQETWNNNEKVYLQGGSDFEYFMALLRKILTIIYGHGPEPFYNIFIKLPEKDRKYLIKIITPLKNDGMLDSVLSLVIKMFKKHFYKDITYLNFLSLLEFVIVAVNELEERIAPSQVTKKSQLKMKDKQNRRICINIINRENTVEELVNKFNQLRAEIEFETSGPNNISPNFRNIFSAVYHYWKHRRIPGDGGIFSVREYYRWIGTLLEKLKKTPQFNQLKNSKKSGTCLYETYVVILAQRFRIIVKRYRSELILSSAFVVENINQFNKDGKDFVQLTFD